MLIEQCPAGKCYSKHDCQYGVENACIVDNYNTLENIDEELYYIGYWTGISPEKRIIPRGTSGWER